MEKTKRSTQEVVLTKADLDKMVISYDLKLSMAISLALSDVLVGNAKDARITLIIVKE